jgi:hypothetical protein
MAQDILTREMVFTAASLSMASARERKVVPQFAEEARLIITGFPGCGVSEIDLAAEMERVFRRQ